MMLSERHDNLLACGVAVSPVVDWRFYGELKFHDRELSVKYHIFLLELEIQIRILIHKFIVCR